MTRSSLTAWFVSGALALALASGGCSSNSPHYVGSGDGPTVQEDGPREAGHGDAVVHTDGEVPDAELPDGEVPDAGLESGPIPDGGTNQPPTVEFTLPATGSSYKGSMVIQFTAKDPDDGLAATAPAITIDGRPVTLTLLSTDDGGAASPQPTAGELTWEVKAVYTIIEPPALDGLAEGTHYLSVTVWDVAGNAGLGTVPFAIDRTGPQIVPVNPVAGQMLGGTVTLDVKITDPAGIDDSSVVLEFEETGVTASIVIPLVRISGAPKDGDGEFTYSYDTGRLPRDMIWPQILWRVKDLLGNEAHLSYEVVVDNTPPMPSLTSGLISVLNTIPCWSKCGDGVCESNETVHNCPADCGQPACGDGVCDLREDNVTCAFDCQQVTCGDGTCEIGAAAESATSCPIDCGKCGDGFCNPATEHPGERVDSAPGQCEEDCGHCRAGGCFADNTIYSCSHWFDPLSNTQWVSNLNGDANQMAAQRVKLKDGATVGQATFMRARVEDRGNQITGQGWMPVSGVDASRVRLYLYPTLGVTASGTGGAPLVISDSGICERINPALHEVGAAEFLTDSTAVLVVDLAPVLPAGGTPDNTLSCATPVPPGCGAIGDPNVLMPPQLGPCPWLDINDQALYVISASYDFTLPAIFSVPSVVAGSDYACQGHQFDAVQFPDGWFCAAVVAYDNVGNMGVSKPLHLCLNKEWTKGGPCDPASPSYQTAGDCAATSAGLQLPNHVCDIPHPYVDEVFVPPHP